MDFHPSKRVVMTLIPDGNRGVMRVVDMDILDNIVM
jgi:hypothetical protein